MTDDLELKELNQFCGTEQYHNVMGVNITDGIKYIMENGYSWFVTDFVVVAKMKLKNQEFLSIKLKLKNETGQMEVTDGNNKILYTQEYKWTNAKKEIQLYFEGNVLMLTGEY